MPASNPAGLDGAWRSLFRFTVGAYWLYFAASKWAGIQWVHAVLVGAAKVNPIPGLKQLLEAFVVPNWQLFTIGQTIGETLVAVLLIAGLATRIAGVLATLLATGLALVIAFGVSDSGFQWLYYLGLLASAQVVASGPGSIALDRLRFVPAWARLGA